MDILPNEENWQIGNWQIATDTIIANIEAQRQNFKWGFRDMIHFETKHKMFPLKTIIK